MTHPEAQTVDPGAKHQVLDPLSRLSEILFGLLMVLTFSCTFSVVSDGQAEVRELLIASIGCNLAWGLVDAVVLLLNRLAERGHGVHLLETLQRTAPGSPRAIELFNDNLPQAIVQVMRPEEVQSLHQRLLNLRLPRSRLLLNWHDLRAAFGVFLLVFLSTLPVVLPFVLIEQAEQALRTSNGVALVMLMLLGLGFGRYAGARRPWLASLLFTVLGVALVAATIALGG
ncbi:hypothetical protein F3I62_06880 [Pseudomonas sp. R-28-1W-6]|jgi:hypothetical protein|uniref:VIT1/CCC1 transporter family protein n=1 Tax=Pseudomonas sp. R-28-1W-6 TaxID=2650101 RepID=UPI0013660A73|nr:VIT1/CCC1 transporter family protein [Pseudomonas sp. R-28-1W-6]MWV11809.1 hypothetical protein [Pseudomonas sp. R-28-1W-6]